MRDRTTSPIVALDKITRIMPELALDHDQRDSLPGHLDRVGMAELVRREPTTHAGGQRDLVQLPTDPRRRARTAARRAAQYTEQPADRKVTPQLEPRGEV